MRRRPSRIVSALLFATLALAVAAPPAAVLFPTSAEAQIFRRKNEEQQQKAGQGRQERQQKPKKERRGFFEFLFGRKEEPAPAPQVKVKRRVPRGAAGGVAGAAGGAVLATPEPEAVVEKAENARVVLVVGDFMASALGEGLDEAFAKSPGVRVVARTDGSSGFVREDHYDWPSKIGEIVAQEKPAAVIVVLGSNDRQQMTVDGKKEKHLSEAWNAAYRARAKALADNVRAAGVPLMWMGLPSFKTAAMSTDMIALNDIYRDVAQQVGGEFIDIWDGFVDENGAFMPVGPDMNGQRVRLRGSDGINMTRAGKRKMAFYAERPLNKLLGGATSPSVSPAAIEGGPTIVPLDPRAIERTAPIALSDPQLDGGAQLLGAQVAARPEPVGMPIERLVREGIVAGSRAGRADDFMVGGSQPAASAAPAASMPLAETPPPLAASGEMTGTIRN